MFPVHPLAILALEDGTTFIGRSIGIAGATEGEVVFNTSITGYQEMLTDPSYCGQILTLTYPHIGNYGTNLIDVQSTKIQAAGLVIRDLALLASNFRNQASLQQYLVTNGLVAIADVDTRKLTRILRSKGAQNGVIVGLEQGQQATSQLLEQAVAKARQVLSLKGQDLAKVVSTKERYNWQQGSWSLTKCANQSIEYSFNIVAIDYGVKHNILCLLADRGCNITVLPAQTTTEQILQLNPDGIFLSNGPGDPQACDYAISSIKELLKTDIPIFGICLGHQLLSLALGAESFKMKFGHHGGNHPVKDLQSGKVCITSQNHGFAIEATSLPSDVQITHISLFDGTVQGIKHKTKPAFSFQGHPEAAPGPQDITYLFDHFIDLMKERKNG